MLGKVCGTAIALVMALLPGQIDSTPDHSRTQTVTGLSGSGTAESEQQHDLAAKDEFHAKQVQNLPGAGKFWFFGLAKVSPESPQTVAIRLYVLDGVIFRMGT